MLFLGNPEYGCELAARQLRRRGRRIRRACLQGRGSRGLQARADDALAHDGPALVDAVVDTNEPMLPPKRRETYVKNLEAALSKGTPRRGDIQRALGEEPAATSLRE